MDLPSKFRRIAHALYKPISQLPVDVAYEIVYAERTHHPGGSTVLMYLAGIDRLYAVYLPKRYACAVSDFDIEDICRDRVWYYLKYKGYSRVVKQHILEITNTVCE